MLAPRFLSALLACTLALQAQTAAVKPTPVPAPAKPAPTKPATNDASPPVQAPESPAAIATPSPFLSPWEEKVRGAMAPSIDRQRASVQKQASAVANIAAAPPESSFVLAWPAPPVINLEQPMCDPMPADKLTPLIEKSAAKEGVKADLIQAVINRESGARACAVSAKGAEGLMQLMPEIAAQFGVSDPFDPEQNISAGAKLLKQLLSKYNGDISLALSAYNAGSGRVDKDGAIPAIPETINYVSDILAKLPALTAGN